MALHCCRGAACDEAMVEFEGLLSGAYADVDAGALEDTGDDEMPGAADATIELVGGATTAFT
ncbi:uncharacterized protein PG998_000255 [Apiospora kogelbergensis]|uniref:uncharacterized protein n=1 Tax=Apiospora kogelbergensis TaxID=1337665 RepID=UPI0031318912